MRSVELAWRVVSLATLSAALVGCAAITAPLKSLQQAVTGTAAPAVAASAPSPSDAPAAAAVATAAPATQVEPDVPVSAATQRAFDDARRLMAAGRTEPAERAFVALALAHPELGGPQANLGVLYRQAGKLPESVAALERAVAASPRQPVYFNQLGISYRQQGQFAKAREAYDKALALDPNYAAALLNLGILNDLYLGDGARALELYDRYVALSPGGDAKVAKWVADLKNRKPQATASAAKKEQS